MYTHPLSQGGASNSHYDGNAQTYMDVGVAKVVTVKLLNRFDEKYIHHLRLCLLQLSGHLDSGPGIDRFRSTDGS